MNSQPTQPFQAPREVLRSRLAGLVQGTASPPERIALIYRVSGGPPGKRLLRVLRLTAMGDVTFEHSDDLKPRETIKASTTVPREEALAVFRQVQGSGFLESRADRGASPRCPRGQRHALPAGSRKSAKRAAPGQAEGQEVERLMGLGRFYSRRIRQRRFGVWRSSAAFVFLGWRAVPSSK